MGLVLRYITFSVIAIALQSVSFHSPAQDRCGTVQYIRSLHRDPLLHKQKFENWLQGRMSLRESNRQGRQQASPYQIPVVVHVIHNGEDIGAGANISDAQILSQLEVLNEDFNRQNADAVNTPQQFASIAGTLDIEFVLAKQDPDGLATNGIVRAYGGRSSWTTHDNYVIKELSYWPAEEYFNIWVCNLTDNLGYAQFPESDLEGMENSSTNRLTDGIVVGHYAFGSIEDGAFNLDTRFDKGRTATHETGHFLGLNHIWGDDVNGCTGSDYVNDTPNQAGRTHGCPTHPRTDTCGEVIMFQNFLDYSDDACMNLFTQGQVNRMVTVLENSPRRNSLLTSPGLEEPDPLPNDLGVRSIVFPDATVCGNQVVPVIEVRNYGNNIVTSARIQFTVDGIAQETKDLALTLDPMESAQVDFSLLTITSGLHEIAFEVQRTNGGADGGSYNDYLSSTLIIPAFAAAPFAENFNTAPAGWIIDNPDGQITWELVTAPKEVPSNKALKLNFYEYENKVGEVDTYLSPVIDLTSAPTATLSFDVAHARFQSSNDRLRVVALTDCQSLAEGIIVYDKAGDSLDTAPATTRTFTPTGADQWRREFVNLSDFVGEDRLQLAFVGVNDWGNNIYLDNITFFTEETFDVSLLRVAKPSLVTCEQDVAPVILVRNSGTVDLSTFNLQFSIDGGEMQTLLLTDVALPYGEEKEIELPILNLTPGAHTLQIDLFSPNGFPDNKPDDNQDEFTFIINQDKDRIPLRQNFDREPEADWVVINPEAGMNWQITSTNDDQSLYFNSYDNTLIGDEAWLVSPVLDFSRTSHASMLFDLSYARRDVGVETLRLFVSTDCGITFNEIDYNFPDVETVTGEWSPQGPADWERNVPVNLNSVAGEENVRIAFVVRNENSNNLFLDNIEFFITADPDPIEINEIYSVYGYDLTNPSETQFKITFNLPERQDVRYSVVTLTGQLETDGILTDVLNQTYPLDISPRLAPGIYVIRLQIGGRYYSSKVLVLE